MKIKKSHHSIQNTTNTSHLISYPLPLTPYPLSIIGLHHSGKTTAVEMLIKYLKSEGFSVSSIKDIHQDGWTMEREGSNSHRHLIASGSYVFARGVTETHLIWQRQLSLNEMLTHIDTDWVIIEGMRDTPLPKIIAAKNTDDIDTLWDDNVIAITGEVSETINIYRDIPCINAITDTQRLVKLVIESYNKQNNVAAMPPTPHKSKITIKIGNQNIPLNNWVATLYTDVIKSLCQNLKGYDDKETIQIDISQ